MELIQSQDAESPGPSSEVIGQKPPKRAYCENCLLGPSDDTRLGNYVYLRDIFASGKSCRACAGIFEFFNSQTSVPVEIAYMSQLKSTETPYFNRLDACRSYEFFTTSDGCDGKEKKDYDEPAPFLDHPRIWRMRAPSGDTSSTEAFDSLKRWISRCEEEHTLCQPTKDPTLPHRVLQIDSIQPLRVRVVEDRPERESYACLSHRWAPQTELSSLKTHNLDIYKTEVPEENFYPLMKDAIEAAFRLDLRFIWIDCYCIIQDDTKDWETAAANMAFIYENAFLTIVATSSDGGRPMFSTTKQEYVGIQVTEIRGEPVFMREQLDSCNLHLRPELANGPLLGRGWVFQERLLSNRLVHFTQDEILWECRERTWCECTSGGLELKERREKDPRTLRSERWEDIVFQFKETELTFAKDTLPALAGVARRYEKVHGGTYLAGLWKEHLPGALTWLTHGCPVPRPLQHVAPTWSWASLPQIRCLYSLDSWSSNCVRLLDWSIQPPDADVYAGGNRLEITLEGPVLDLKVYKHDDGLVGISEDSSFWIWPDFKVDPEDLTKHRAVPDGSSCLLLIMARSHEVHPRWKSVNGIVLLQNDDTESDVPKFERIGGFYSDSFGGKSYRLDQSDEFAGFPPFLIETHPDWRRHVDRLLERAKT